MSDQKKQGEVSGNSETSLRIQVKRVRTKVATDVKAGMVVSYVCFSLSDPTDGANKACTYTCAHYG